MNKSTIKNFVVTGSNKGIGFSIIDKLFRDVVHNQSSLNNTNIILCSRSVDNGVNALNKLKENNSKNENKLVNNTNLKNKNNLHIKDKNLSVIVEELDITNKSSISSFVKIIKETYDGKIDCLVNNAGVAAKGDKFDTEVFNYTLGTNFYSTVEFTETMLKENLITENGKIVFIGSSLGKLHIISNPEIKNRLKFDKNKNLDINELKKLAEEYKNAIETNTVEKGGWSKNIYGFSKILINKYAYYLGHHDDILSKGIQVYSCCPGWVRTDMGGEKAHRSLEEGAENPTYLVNLDFKINKELQGQFFYDKKVCNIDN